MERFKGVWHQFSGPCFLCATNLPAFNFGRNQSFVYQAWFADPQEEGTGKTRLQNSRRKTKRGPETRKTRPQDTLRWVQNLTKVKILRPLTNLGFWRTQICKVTCALKHSTGNIYLKDMFVRSFCECLNLANLAIIVIYLNFLSFVVWISCCDRDFKCCPVGKCLGRWFILVWRAIMAFWAMALNCCAFDSNAAVFGLFAGTLSSLVVNILWLRWTLNVMALAIWTVYHHVVKSMLRDRAKGVSGVSVLSIFMAAHLLPKPLLVLLGHSGEYGNKRHLGTWKN